ncbi:hypothetical protein JXJ21_01665 [candidate division KSB1 bacterium]|nr:hypothetical protein [candidate division KSB1 bacterium]
MTSREIVRRTVDFEHPIRVARSFGESDFAGATCAIETCATKWREISNGRWERIDEWGNVWGRIDPTSKGEVLKGVLDNLNALDSYELPDYSKPEDYVNVREARNQAQDKWFIGGLPGFAFNIARKMRKLDQYLIDILLERDRIRELHDRIDDMLEAGIRNYAAAGVDSIMFCEDWGTQSQTLVSPGLWMEEFYPRFERLCGIAHAAGIKVFMHSCGQIEAIVPGLMRAGVDLLQFDQPALHGIDTLAAHQNNGKITFWCPVDIQKTLQTKNEKKIRAEAREMLDKLWQGRGGFVAGYYGDNPSIGLEPVWQDIACDEFTRSGIHENYKE